MAAGSSLITEEPRPTSCAPATPRRNLPSFSPTGWQRTASARSSRWFSDYAPGIVAEKSFAARFTSRRRRRYRGDPGAAGQSGFLAVSAACRGTAKPDAIFVFIPSGQGGTLMRQFAERGLDKAGIKVIGNGTVTDDDQLSGMGDAAIGIVTAHHYSAAHPSAINKAYVAAFEKANRYRPNFMSVSGYDGMALIYKALDKTGGEAWCRRAGRGNEGTAVGKSARPDFDRSRNPRYRSKRIHPPRRGKRTGYFTTRNLPPSKRSKTR